MNSAHESRELKFRLKKSLARAWRANSGTFSVGGAVSSTRASRL